MIQSEGAKGFQEGRQFLIITKQSFLLMSRENFFVVIPGERSRLLPAESNSIIEEGSQESLQTQEPNYYNQRSQVARV